MLQFSLRLEVPAFPNALFKKIFFFSLLLEIAGILGDRKEVTGDDLDELKYTEQVCAEFSNKLTPSIKR